MPAITSRPRKAALVAKVSAAAVVMVFGTIAWALGGHAGLGGGAFSLPSQIGVALVGLIGAGGLLVFGSPRLYADEVGLRVRNLLPTPHLVEWADVAGFRFGDGSPWAFIQLLDGDEVPVLAVQAADGRYAEETVAALRKLHASITAD